MERINYNSLKFIEFFDKINPQNSGIIFSISLHLLILLFAVGLPNFFGPKDVFVPNIIPIEILNVSETTNIEKSENENEINKNTTVKQKKFNSSENTEVKKEFDITQNMKTISDDNQPDIKIKEKSNLLVEEKKNIEPKQKENILTKTKVETIKSNEIKPKLKPKPKKTKPLNTKSDLQIEEKNENKTNPDKKEISIASMLKDLRNEKSNNIVEDKADENNQDQSGKDEVKENIVLSISEIDLLRQQLSSCWNAPAGAVIERGMKVTISAKVQQNMNVFQNSVRIVDTNIPISNAFYGPITDSAMRTLLNPECTPLKLPKDKYSLWKNLTITFDYSIMKGY